MNGIFIGQPSSSLSSWNVSRFGETQLSEGYNPKNCSVLLVYSQAEAVITEVSPCAREIIVSNAFDSFAYCIFVAMSRDLVIQHSSVSNDVRQGFDKVWRDQRQYSKQNILLGRGSSCKTSRWSHRAYTLAFIWYCSRITLFATSCPSADHLLARSCSTSWNLHISQIIPSNGNEIS